MSSHCNKQECNRYSDVDVYYTDRDRPAVEMCAEHAWHEPDTVALITQHGSDNINREIG